VENGVNKPNKQNGKAHSTGSYARQHERPHKALDTRFKAQSNPPAPPKSRQQDRRQR